MGTKHDSLTEEELSEYSVAPNVLQELTELQESLQLPAGEINVLDWGCGRGRSVALLREMGYNACGVEIDRKTMENGFELFRNRGLDPASLLRHLDDIDSFEDSYFHFVFSEQVFEHVADLNSVAADMARLTRSGGTGVHNFPSARCVEEEHLFMPYVHWLPKNQLRYLVIRLMVGMGMGPKPAWPEVIDSPSAVKARFYFDYSVERTFYRDVREIEQIFRTAGFDATAAVPQMAGRLKRLITPDYLVRNGYPNRRTVLSVRRR